MNRKKILFFYQNAFSEVGGIQTFNKFFIKALEELQSKHDSFYIELASVYDNEKDIKSTLPITLFYKSKIEAMRHIFFKAKKYDIFIFAHINLALLALIVKILNPKANIIFCTHGIEIWKKLPKFTELIINKSIILTVSTYSKNQLLKYNPNIKDIRIFPNCINIKQEFNNLNPFIDNNFNLLSITRLSRTEKLKGIDLVIKTLPFLVKEIPNIKYNVIGKGDDKERLLKLAKQLGVEKNVEFKGFVDNLAPYYEYCDVFILPSKKEGFGIVYLEAMQYRKPCIACDEGGQTDVVIDGKTGYLCKYGDINCLKNKILDLYKDENKRKKFGESGYIYLVNNFTFEHFKKNLENILKGI